MSFWPTRGIRESDLFILIKSLSIGNALIFVALFIYIARQVRHIITAHQRSCLKVMFSAICRCQSVHKGVEVSMWLLPMIPLVSHMGEPTPHPTPPHMRTPLQPRTFSNFFHLDVTMQGLKSGRLAFDWKTFLVFIWLILYCIVIWSSIHCRVWNLCMIV